MKTRQKADSGTVEALEAALDLLGSYYRHDH